MEKSDFQLANDSISDANILLRKSDDACVYSEFVPAEYFMDQANLKIADAEDICERLNDADREYIQHRLGRAIDFSDQLRTIILTS